jgi:hypothetical protein
MPFDYTSGNPDNLTGGGPARMQDIQGPFYDLRAYLNSAVGGGGSTVPVLSGVPVLDVGMVNQRRAGRQLANADFTALGLSVPIALWNLSDTQRRLGQHPRADQQGRRGLRHRHQRHRQHRRDLHRLDGAGALHRRHRRRRPAQDQDRIVGLLVPHGQARHGPEPD